MMGMIEDSDDSIAAATGYTDSFFDAAIAKIDATFGAGFAKANPSLIGALVQASAANLNAFMMAATDIPMGLFDMLPEELPELPVKPKRGKR